MSGPLYVLCCLLLILLLKNVGAFDFGVIVFRVARSVHVVDQEHAALLGFAVVAEHAIALVLETFLILACVVVVFFFAVREEAAVLFALAAPAHAGTTVEDTYATARDHDVELALFHVGTDVRDHDDELLALDGLRVRVRRAVVALAGEGQLEALAASSAVAGGHCREGESHIGTSVNRERNLARASHGRTLAVANALVAAVVGVLSLALVGALPRVIAVRMFRPGTVRLAAIPVTCGPAATARAALRLDGGAPAGSRTAALGRGAALGGRTAVRVGTAALGRGTAVGVGGGLDLFFAARRFFGGGGDGAAVADIVEGEGVQVHDGHDAAVDSVKEGDDRGGRKVGEADVVAVHVGDDSEFVVADDEFAASVLYVPGRRRNDDGGRVDRFAGERCQIDVLDEGLPGGGDDGARGAFSDEERADQGAVALGDDHVGINNDVHAACEVEGAFYAGFRADLEGGRRFGFRRRRVGTVPNARGCK